MNFVLGMQAAALRQNCPGDLNPSHTWFSKPIQGHYIGLPQIYNANPKLKN